MNIFDIAEYSHYMVDIETTGISPTKNLISSAAFVKFMPATGEICKIYHKKFDTEARVPELSDRCNNISTMQWRIDNHVDEMELGVPLHKNVKDCFLIDIPEFLNFDKHIPVLWANHKEFDVGFLKSYYDSFASKSECPYPWHYRYVMDCADIKMFHGISSEFLNKKIQADKNFKLTMHKYFDGEPHPHDALYDCMYQIFAVKTLKDFF